MNNPRVTIVVPLYNGERHLEDTVKAIQAQTIHDWEMIIVDDGSRDNSFELAKALAETDTRISAITQPNGGVSLSRNAGMAHADPNALFVAFVDQDDVWMPDALELLLAKVEESTDYVGAHGLGKFIDGNGSDILKGECEAMCRIRPTVENGRVRPSRPDEPSTLEAFIVSGCVVCPAAVLFRRAAVEKVGGFLPEFAMCTEWNLYIRLAKLGPIGYVDRVVLGYRKHEHNVSNDTESHRKEQKRVLVDAVGAALDESNISKRIRTSYKASQRYYVADKLKLALHDLGRFRIHRALKQFTYACNHTVKYFTGKP